MGAAGGIGQPLSLLLKQSPLISKLALYDIVATPGVAADLSHIESRAQVSSHLGPEELDSSLDGCDVVVIPAGVPRKPGWSRIDTGLKIRSLPRGDGKRGRRGIYLKCPCPTSSVRHLASLSSLPYLSPPPFKVYRVSKHGSDNDLAA